MTVYFLFKRDGTLACASPRPADCEAMRELHEQTLLDRLDYDNRLLVRDLEEARKHFPNDHARRARIIRDYRLKIADHKDQLNHIKSTELKLS
jgi:hypothetical protein